MIHFEGDIERTQAAVARHASKFFCVERGCWQEIARCGDCRLQGQGASSDDVVVCTRLAVGRAAKKLIPPQVMLVATPACGEVVGIPDVEAEFAHESVTE